MTATVNEQLRRQIIREFPELAAGYHMPVMAEVTGISDAPAAGGISDNYRPRFAVTVDLLTTQYKKTGISLDAVPVAITGGGDERGFFAMPARGTIVELAWLNGSPERPFVRSILGDRQALPCLDADTMSWQQSEDCFQRVDASGNWQRETTESISDKSHSYEQQAVKAMVTLGNEVRRILEHSVEDIDGKKQIEATAIHLISATVLNLLAAGSINQVSAEYATRAATKGIKDKTGQSLELTAGVDVLATAARNIKLQGQKIHIGSETTNALQVVSDFMQTVSDALTAISTMTVTCTAPSSPSSPPINAASFTQAVTAIGTQKSSLDAIKM